MKKTCLYCGEEFNTPRISAKYCSPLCYRRAVDKQMRDYREDKKIS